MDYCAGRALRAEAGWLSTVTSIEAVGERTVFGFAAHALIPRPHTFPRARPACACRRVHAAGVPPLRPGHPALHPLHLTHPQVGAVREASADTSGSLLGICPILLLAAA